jgi:hypothetical protein
MADKFEFKFVNLVLTDEELMKMDTLIAKEPDRWEAWLKDVMESGYKVSMSKPAALKGMYQAMLSPSAKDNSNYGMGLTGTGSSPWEALQIVLFKHSVVLKRDWSSATEAPRKRG